MLIVLLFVVVAHAACASSAPSVPPPSAAAPADSGERARALLARGQTLLGRGDMVGAAIALRQALALDADLTAARSALGLALYGAGDTEAAVDELRAALARDAADVGVRVALGAALIARQDWTGARAELEEVIRRQPEHAQAHYGLGLVRYAQRDLLGAAEAYRRALSIEPNQHDARYNLALVLKLAGLEADATREFVTAAEAGVGRAQYFSGVAYADGLGVPRSLPTAIAWWMRAAERGVAPAEDALAALRQAALGRSRRPIVERQAAEQGFRDYRAGLWSQLPDVGREGEESAGLALVRLRRPEAVAVLIREAAALDDDAQQQLEVVYEQGLSGVVAPYDARILAWFQRAAAEGLPRPRIALARVYGRGLGVPRDVPRAVALLRATPHEDARRLLEELAP